MMVDRREKMTLREIKGVVDRVPGENVSPPPKIKENKMTNREWLETLSDEELASEISTRCGLCANHDVNDCWDCVSNITTWLTQEYKPPILERVSKPDREEKAMTKQEILGYLSELYDMIEELPSEELARHGKWEMKPDPLRYIPVCSECGCKPKMRGKTKYCPNCGAKMDKDGEQK